MAALPHRAHVVKAASRDQQTRRGVAHPARLQRLELLGQAQAQLVPGDHGVDALDALQQVGREHRLGVRLERGAEGLELRGVDGQARRGAVAAVAAQVRRPRIQRAEQVKAGDAAPRPAAALALERHQHRGAVVAFDDPRGDDPDHARVPVL